MSNAPTAGLLSVLVTPFGEDGRLDEESLAGLVRFLLDRGADGLLALGVMGEAAALEDSERERVLAIARELTPADATLVVGASAAEPAVAARRAEAAAAAGADAVMVAVPPRAARLGEHFGAVAAAVPGLPIVLQDYPASGHEPVATAEILALAERVPEIVAVKEEDLPSASRIAELRAGNPELGLFGGLGGLWSFWELRAGAGGLMTGFAFPEPLAELIEAAAGGDWSAAASHYRRALPAIAWEAQPTIGLRLRKLALRERGAIAGEGLRIEAPPMPPGAAEQARELIATLTGAPA